MTEPQGASASKRPTIHYLIYFALLAILALQMGLTNRKYDNIYRVPRIEGPI